LGKSADLNQTAALLAKSLAEPHSPPAHFPTTGQSQIEQKAFQSEHPSAKRPIRTRIAVSLQVLAWPGCSPPILAISGIFAGIEAAKGWRLLRACGIKTRLQKARFNAR